MNDTKITGVTRDLLKVRSETLEVISKATGLPVFWLLSFQNARLKNPSADSVQTLYEHLSGHKLELVATPKGV